MREKRLNNGCGPISLAAVLVAIFVACGLSEVGVPEIPEAEEQDGISSPFRTICCISGFEYPSGYDWNGEPQAGEVRCSLVVFADGVPKIKVPVGDGYEVSRDYDMHRVIQGNLYTFYSKAGRTVIRRNGAPLFRYDGDEVLVDMSVKDNNVYTLAHRRTGGGFAFRKNGNILVERLAGETYGRLWNDGDSLCFAFMQPVALADGMEYRHYIVYDERVERLEVADDIEKIWDLQSGCGIPCILASLESISGTFICRDGSRKRIEMPDSAGMLSCRLFQADSLMGAECMYGYPDGRCESGIWVEGSEYVRFEAGRSIQGLKYERGKAYCVLNPDVDEGIIYSAGILEKMPQGYFCLDDRALAVHDGSFHVAMSSKNGNRPIIWNDGRTDTLRLNGCVSSITFTELKGG